MNKVACQYAIVQFAPFVETGEFANVGIIMIAPKQRYYGFELELKRYGRITNFFDDVDAQLYKKTLYNLKDELDRVSYVFREHGFDKRLKTNDVEFANGLFNEIVRTRETIVRFSEIRSVLVEKPEQKLKELFAYYVERNFANKEYKEALLEKSVRKLLYTANVGEKFTKEKVGNDVYHVTFPFVNRLDNALNKVIKPLHLAHDEPTKIYDHGASWIYRIKKLKDTFIDPEHVLFTLAAPEGNQNRLGAYRDIKRELENTGVQIASSGDTAKIVDFALH